MPQFATSFRMNGLHEARSKPSHIFGINESVVPMENCAHTDGDKEDCC